MENKVKDALTNVDFRTAFQKLMLDNNIDINTTLNISDIYNTFVSAILHEVHEKNNPDCVDDIKINSYSVSKYLTKEEISNLKSGQVIVAENDIMRYIGCVSVVNADKGDIGFHCGISLELDQNGIPYDNIEDLDILYVDAIYDVYNKWHIAWPTPDIFDKFVNKMEEEGNRFDPDNNCLVTEGLYETNTLDWA